MKNLLADPECVVASRDAREPRRAELLAASERIAQVVATYIRLMNAPWALAQFPFPADATIATIEQVADRVAVFELTGRGTTGAS